MDINQGKRLVLASASPRRKEIFQRAGFHFRVQPSRIEENMDRKLEPGEMVRMLALQKARDVADQITDEAVVGAETLVYLDDDLLSKPVDQEDAVRMLLRLQGRVHTVYTGYALIADRWQFSVTRSVATQVELQPLTLAIVREYVQTGEPMDKAGAYGIQDRGALFVKSINGCYFNVMGFPISEFYMDWRNLAAM